MEIIAWDTDLIQMRPLWTDNVEQIVDHYMGTFKFDPKERVWRFLARFKGLGPEDDVWIPWSKANELPAMDDYSAAHNLKVLNTPDNLNLSEQSG